MITALVNWRLKQFEEAIAGVERAQQSLSELKQDSMLFEEAQCLYYGGIFALRQDQFERAR